VHDDFINWMRGNGFGLTQCRLTVYMTANIINLGGIVSSWCYWRLNFLGGQWIFSL